MEPYSDLDGILRDGYSLKYDWQYQGLQTVTISTQEIGGLVLTSGQILGCDPLIGPDTRYAFKKVVAPGRYPVVLSVADFQPTGDMRVACAAVHFGDGVPTRWEIATIKEPNPLRSEERTAYGVDAGTGSFLDVDAARILESLFPREVEFENFCDGVIAEMNKTSLGNYANCGWANVAVGASTQANLIAFSSGWGDGAYASFWGYDARDQLTSLVTDFALFPKRRGITTRWTGAAVAWFASKLVRRRLR